MSVEYRQLRPDEEDALLDIVAAVMGDERAEQQRVLHDFADDPQRFARTHVVATGDALGIVTITDVLTPWEG